MSEPTNPNPEKNSPVLKRRTLITGASGATNSGPKLVSEAELVESAPRARFLTPMMQKQLEEEQAQQAQQAELDAVRIAAEQEAARVAAEQEAARLAIEQEKEAARIAAEQEAARVAAEEEAARIAAEQEAARLAAEQEAARLAAEKESARLAAEQAQPQTTTTNTELNDSIDPKIQAALDQIKLAQEALAAAQEQAMAMATLSSSLPTGTSSSPATEANKGSEQQATSVFNVGANTSLQTTSPQPSEPPKKTLFKVGGVATGREDKPKTADSLKGKIAASLNQATSGNTAVDEPSPILSPDQTAPVAQKAPIVIDLPSPAQVMPEAIWKKKSFKIGAIIGACVLILSAILIVMAFNSRAEQKRQNEHLTKLCEIGSQLGRKAAELGGTTGSDLKYDRAKYKIDINPNEKDAKILLDRVGSKEQQGGWESAAHYLGVMGQVDPKIAKMTIDSLAKNPKLYMDNQYMMLVSILACDKDPNIQKLLLPLMTKLEAAKQYRKAGIVLKQMRYGMTPNDVSSIMKYLTDEKANGELASAARECLKSITYKADAAGKSVVSKNLITELRKDIPVAQRAGLFGALALTGTPEAQAYFQEYIKDKQPTQIRIALRSLGEWGNDNIIPFLMELRKDPVLTADKTVKNDLDRILLQRLSKDGERTEEQGTALFKPLIDEAEELTKNAKTPQDTEAAQTLKMLIVSAAGQLKERPYVTQIMELYKKDSDEKVSSTAKKVEARMKEMEQRRNAPKVSTEDKAKAWEKRFAQ